MTRGEESAKSSLIGFTSGTGGSGTTSTALMLAQNYSELCGHSTVFLSLDLLSSKACYLSGPSRRMLYEAFFSGEDKDPKTVFSRDACGVYHIAADGPRNPLTLADADDLIMILKKLSGCFEKIVIDVPASCGQAPELLDVCDIVVVCYGWNDKLFGASDELAEMLESGGCKVFRFCSLHDEAEPDLYGQLGSEVRRLAQQF